MFVLSHYIINTDFQKFMAGKEWLHIETTVGFRNRRIEKIISQDKILYYSVEKRECKFYILKQ